MDVPKITITEKFEIQVFVCYCLTKFGKMAESNLLEIITEDDAVNYFDFISALSQMEDKEMISIEKKDGGDIFSVLETGKMLAAEFENKIPLSIREKAATTGKKIKNRTELEQSARWHIDRINDTDGYYFCVEFLNEMGGSDMMQLKVYAPSFDAALNMQARFLKRPSDILTKIMSMFMRDGIM